MEYRSLKKRYSEEKDVTRFPVKCVELLRKDPRVNWNVKNVSGETPIMVALKNKETEMVKILLRTPGVSRDDVTQSKEGKNLLREVFQEAEEQRRMLKEVLQGAEEKRRNLAGTVPECPVKLCQHLTSVTNFSVPDLLEPV